MKHALGALAVLAITGCTSTTASVQPTQTTTAATAEQPSQTIRTGPPAEPPQLAYDQWISVKYRDTPVDLSAPGFARLDLIPGGDVGEAWWDSRYDYMVIELTGTWYHYCAFTVADADQFEAAPSASDYYQAAIKGTHDCRYEGVIPDYGTLMATAEGSTSSGSYDFDADAERERMIEDAEFDLGRSIDEEQDYEILDEIDQEIEDQEYEYSETGDDQ